MSFVLLANVLYDLCTFREGKFDVLRDLCNEHKHEKVLYQALKSKVKKIDLLLHGSYIRLSCTLITDKLVAGK